MLALLVGAATKVAVYCLVLALSLWCWFQWKWQDFLQVARKLPCTVRPLPVIGHAYLLLKGWEAYSKVVLEKMSIEAVSQQLYTVCRWCGPLPIIMVHKLEDVQKILSSSCTAEKGREYDYFGGGNGLLTAPGDIHKITRRHITPLFHSHNIEQLMVVFNNNSRELVADLAEHVDGEPVDMLHPAMSVALKTVCQIVFGKELEFDTKTKAFKSLVKYVEMVPALFLKRISIPYLRIDFIFNWLYRKELKEMDSLLAAVTEKPLKMAKLNYTNKSKCVSSEPDIIDGFKKEGSINLVEIYTELQNKYPQFSEKDLINEIKTLYCTGTDTVGLAVSSCLLALGRHSDIQDRVYEEISEVVGPDDDVTMDHIRRMQYLDQVYKETLRWSIIVPYLLRRTTEEIKLSSCSVPAGYSVSVCLVGPHMDPNYYPNPLQFDPEHFSPKNSTKKNAFIPFSSGSRMCIAKTYAEYLVKTMLIHVLRRYRVATDMDIYNLKKSMAVTVINTEGYNLKFTNRKLHNIFQNKPTELVTVK